MSREIKFIEWLNNKLDLNLKKTDDKFCRWDAENDIYLVELKIRGRYYSEKLLQADKGLGLIQSAESLDKIQQDCYTPYLSGRYCTYYLK